MAIARYDPYTDSFVYEDSKTSINGTSTISLESFPKNIIQRNVVELSDDSIDKIAEAVVRKLAEQTEPSWEEVKEYCNKRCLDIVDSGFVQSLYNKQTERSEGWSNDIATSAERK